MLILQIKKNVFVDVKPYIIMKKLVFSVFVIGALAISSCTVHDPKYDDVVPPVINFEGVKLTGLVTSSDGKPISGAAVLLEIGGKQISLTTDSEGRYSTDASVGQYNGEASASGYLAAQHSITIEKSASAGKIYTLNFVLMKDNYVEFSDNVEIVTDAIVNNNKAETPIKVDVDHEAYHGTFFLRAFYESDQVPFTKSTILKDRVLLGVQFGQVEADDNSVSTIRIAADKEVQNNTTLRMLGEDGQWKDIDYVSTDDAIIIKDAQIGYYALFCDIIEDKKTVNASVSFDPETIDNLNGTVDNLVSAFAIVYTSGIEMSTLQGKVQLQALLLEKLAYDYGFSKEVKQEYVPVNFQVPYGTAVRFLGSQPKIDITYTKGQRTVHGYQYGAVSYSASTYNRRHTGGSN